MHYRDNARKFEAMKNANFEWPEKEGSLHDKNDRTITSLKSVCGHFSIFALKLHLFPVHNMTGIPG